MGYRTKTRTWANPQVVRYNRDRLLKEIGLTEAQAECILAEMMTEKAHEMLGFIDELGEIPGRRKRDGIA